MALSRRRKVLILMLGLPFALVAALIVAVCLPAVQTYAARKALAGQGGEVGRVAVGLGGAELSGLTLTQPGLKVVVPNFKADVPLVDAAGGAVEVRGLVARDIVIEVDPEKMQAAAKEKPPAEKKAATPFAGVLRAVVLPKLGVEGVDLAGVIRVAGKQPMEATFAVTGGGIQAGATGKIEVRIEAKAGLGTVTTLIALEPTLGADGQLTAVAAALEAAATSKFLAEPTRLRTTLVVTQAAGAAGGEDYALRLIAGERPLVELDTRWAPGAKELPGRWKIALGDADLAPFALGLALPEFLLAGEGELTVVNAEKLRVGGGLTVKADGLEIVGLPKLGPVAVEATFAVEAGEKTARVERLALKVAGAQPVLSVETRQAFEVELASKKITPGAAGAELAEVRLLGVPKEWVKLFAPELALGGGVTGAWSVKPAGAGFEVTASAPLVATGVRYGAAGGALVDFEEVRVEGLRLKQDGGATEAEIGRVVVVAGGLEVVTLKAAATQAAGGPLVAKGELRAMLAKLADQPVARGQTRLSAGLATVGFEATAEAAGGVTAAAKVRLTGLRAAGAGDLPEVALDVAATRDAAGVVAAKVPVTVTNAAAKRSSDVELAVTFTPGKAAAGKAGVATEQHVAAKLTSAVLFVEDLRAFAAVAAEAKPAATPPEKAGEKGKKTEPAGPLWAGTTGEVELALGRIVHAPGIEVLNTKGRLELTREAAGLQALQLMLGTGGTLDVSGALKWLAAGNGYALAADVKGTGVAAGPLLKALDPRAAASPIEGTYDLRATLAGEGRDPGAAAAGAALDVKLTGRAGVIRAINLETNKYAKAGATVSGLAGLAGLAGALSGNEELTKQANRVTALNAVTRAFGNLAYDEITVEARRGADGSVEIGKVGLVSPQLRLTGSGGLRQVPGRTLMELPLSLRLELGARGEMARNLAMLKLVNAPAADAAADAYAMLAEPLVLDGTLKEIGTAQVTRVLTRAMGL